jgi:hypothetical protein
MQPAEEKEIIDQTTEKVVEILGNNQHVKTLRKSQVLSAVIGAIGFALFIDGVGKLVLNLPAGVSLFVGLILMLATGLLIQNLSR